MNSSFPDRWSIKDQPFSITGIQIQITKGKEQKGLGVIIDNTLKFVPNIQSMKKKTNMNLGIIKRTISYIDKTLFINLYKAIVQQNLEYASTVWSVIYKKDYISIENVRDWYIVLET